MRSLTRLRGLHHFPPKQYASNFTDYDGNPYTTIDIGNQRWIVENLRVVHYSDGTPIVNITDPDLWKADTIGAYCWYENDARDKEIYGALYNWYAVDHASILVYFKRGSVQEIGWRMPTVADMITLYTLLGGLEITGGKLKEIGLGHWITPNIGATDEYHWRGLGAGNRFIDIEEGDAFSNRGIYADFWLADEGGLGGFCFYLDNESAFLNPSSFPKYCGQNVRCIKDI